MALEAAVEAAAAAVAVAPASVVATAAAAAAAVSVPELAAAVAPVPGLTVLPRTKAQFLLSTCNAEFPPWSEISGRAAKSVWIPKTALKASA